MSAEIKKQVSIKKNFIMNACLTMSSFLFPLITFPYVSRVLLAAGTGRVSFATSLISYFDIFAQLGIPTYGIRAVARVRDDKEELSRLSHELLIINLIMTAFTYLTLALALVFVPRLFEDRLLYIIISLTIILNSIGMEWLYKGLEQYTYITIRSISFKVIAVIAMFLLVHQQEDYVIYGAISIFAVSASNLLNFINIHKYIDFKSLRPYNLRRHIKPILVFFSMACATTIYTNLDTVMLGFMTTNTDVGYYNAAVKIKHVLVGLVTSLGAVLLPRVSYYIEHGEIEEFKRISRKALQFVLFVSIPITVYFMIFARNGVFFLSGDAFAGAVLPMQIIMPTVILIGITNITGIQILVPQGKERYVLYSEIVGAFADLILNWILIPKYKAAGAATGTLVAEILVLAVQFTALRHDIREILKGTKVTDIIVGVLIGSAASFWITSMNWGNFYSLLVSALLFFLFYYAYMVFRHDETAVYILRELGRKIKRT